MAILSIQSHVSYGHAGNSAAIFPLQYLGNNVWPVYTVNFSNHTGHGKWKGEAIPAKMIGDIIGGIFEIANPKDCDAILSGYLGTKDVVTTVENAVKNLKDGNKDLVFCCDPVMGDVGRGLFVNPDIPALFVSNLIPVADIIVPNHFEFNYICGESNSYSEVLKNAQKILDKGVEWIIVKSFIGTETPKDTLDILAISKNKSYKVNTPNIKYENSRPPVGTGDFFTALFLGNYIKSNKNLVSSLETSCSTIYNVLKTTWEHKKYEIEIVAQREQILRPTQMFKASELN